LNQATFVGTSDIEDETSGQIGVNLSMIQQP